MNRSDEIIAYASDHDDGRNGPHDKYWHCFASCAPGRETLVTYRLFPLMLLLDWANFVFGAAADRDGGRKVHREQQANGRGQKPWHVSALYARFWRSTSSAAVARARPPAQLRRGRRRFDLRRSTRSRMRVKVLFRFTVTVMGSQPSALHGNCSRPAVFHHYHCK
jgi:hypothetical protein